MTDHNENYQAEAVQLVGSKLAELPSLVALLESYAAQVQALEDDAWDVLTEAGFDIEDAEGVQLDRIGSIIGQPRWDLSDADYRNLLRARIVANVSKGTPEDLISLLTALLGERVYTYARSGIAYAQITWSINPLSSDQTVLNILDLVQVAKPVGCTIALAETDSSVVDPFVFGSSGDGWGLMQLATRRLI